MSLINPARMFIYLRAVPCARISSCGGAGAWCKLPLQRGGRRARDVQTSQRPSFAEEDFGVSPLYCGDLVVDPGHHLQCVLANASGPFFNGLWCIELHRRVGLKAIYRVQVHRAHFRYSLYSLRLVSLTWFSWTGFLKTGFL